MEVFDSKLAAIGLALDLTIQNRATLQIHGAKCVGVFSDSQAAM